MKIELSHNVRHLERTIRAMVALNVTNESATYIEVGAHRGRSIGTIGNFLKDKCKKLHIIGYDIFDAETSSFHIKEDNGKGAGNIIKCNKALSKLCKRNPHVTYELVEGYTTDSLKPSIAEWAYIDGGHSYETVKWDHEQLKDCSVIVFDDADLQGVNQYLWEIKDQYNIYDLESTEDGARQACIVNDKENFNFDAAGFIPFRGCDPKEWKPIR